MKYKKEQNLNNRQNGVGERWWSKNVRHMVMAINQEVRRLADPI